MPDNAMVTTDIGNICSVSNSYLRFEKPNSFFAAMSFGNCGYAYPTAIGAKVARPDRPAFAYVGDGAWGMSLQETLTAVRENIPADRRRVQQRPMGCREEEPDRLLRRPLYRHEPEEPELRRDRRSRWAPAASRSSAPTEIGDAVRTAAESDLATVIEVMVTQELGDPFRRDALKKPVRLLDKYKGYSVA